jgi:serine protease Do
MIDNSQASGPAGALPSRSRRAFPALWAVAALCLFSTPPGRADVIELKTGQKIEGDVLKDAGGELVIDLGVDIVRIPVSQIKTRQAKGDAVKEDAQATSDRHEIYSTADLPVRTIKELTLKFAEGVVLVQTPSGLGSGFVLDDRGYCVTNYHVVEQETRIAVTIFHRNAAGEFVRRRIDDVAIVALNPFFDLALLQVPVQKDIKFQSVYLARNNDQREGDEVFAIGNPLGLERSVSQGIISTRNRNFNGITFIQTTAEINPGNSGGPLFNLRGEVVGVTNMKLQFSEGLGFAIPVTYVKHFLDNRDAFAFDKNNPNTGFRYLEAPRRKNFSAVPPPASSDASTGPEKPAAAAKTN